MSGKIFSAKAAQKYANAEAQLNGYIKALKKQGRFKNPVAGTMLGTKGVRIPYNDKVKFDEMKNPLMINVITGEIQQ